MIPNLYVENGCFTKHPFINGCLGFQVWLVNFWVDRKTLYSFFFPSGFSGAMRNLLKIAMFFLRQHGEFMPSINSWKTTKDGSRGVFFWVGLKWKSGKFKNHRSETLHRNFVQPKINSRKLKIFIGDRGDLYNGNKLQVYNFFSRGLLYTLNQVLKVALLWQNASRTPKLPKLPLTFWPEGP